jgi:acylglycerol lipase
MKWIRLSLGAAVIMVSLTACAPRRMAVGDQVVTPREAEGSLVMSDGAHLPLRSWEAEQPRAVLLALHGFNDYSNAFAMPGEWFAKAGVSVYAYDQRGFGLAPGRGMWADRDRLSEDLRNVTSLLRARHPGIPFYIVGESMGGALLMRTMAAPNPPEADGIILAAPAVWGWRSMNDFYATMLWVSAHLVPYMEVTGQGLNRRASDNIEMLRGLGRDPLVIKETRIDAIYGLVELMDDGAAAAPHIKTPTLFIYGAHDEIVPPEPVAKALRDMKSRASMLDAVSAMCYPNGWHMLLRDNERETVWRDMAAWMSDGNAPLPSGFSDLAPCGPLANK